ncbi:hypothetical protein T484DRAFT_1766986 [Baffinella frigidus]|nr:hypothetical protein T484DRAFT_1766986 [Cryptophyta sp. CCMP2293]
MQAEVCGLMDERDSILAQHSALAATSAAALVQLQDVQTLFIDSNARNGTLEKKEKHTALVRAAALEADKMGLKRDLARASYTAAEKDTALAEKDTALAAEKDTALAALEETNAAALAALQEVNAAVEMRAAEAERSKTGALSDLVAVREVNVGMQRDVEGAREQARTATEARQQTDTALKEATAALKDATAEREARQQTEAALKEASVVEIESIRETAVAEREALRAAGEALRVRNAELELGRCGGGVGSCRGAQERIAALEEEKRMHDFQYTTLESLLEQITGERDTLREEAKVGVEVELKRLRENLEGDVQRGVEGAKEEVGASDVVLKAPGIFAPTPLPASLTTPPAAPEPVPVELKAKSATCAARNTPVDMSQKAASPPGGGCSPVPASLEVVGALTAAAYTEEEASLYREVTLIPS